MDGAGCVPIPDDVVVVTEDSAGDVVDRLREAAAERSDSPLYRHDAGDFTFLSHSAEMDQNSLVVAFGGCLYNAPGQPEAYIAEQYRDRGPSFVNHLTGSFRLVLYDIDRGRLYAATDRTGSKPCYYRERGGFVFGSHLSLLLAHPDVENQLDRVAARDYLHTCFLTTYSGDRTLVEGVQRMHNSQLLEYDGSSISTSVYWEVYGADTVSVTDDVAAKQLKQLLRDAVSRSLTCQQQQPAVLFSGGFDSVFLTALIQDGTDQPVHTWTYGTVDDQLARGRVMADRLGTEHHELDLPKTFLEPWEMWAMEAPTLPQLFFRFPRLADAGVSACYSGTSDSITFPVALSNLRRIDRFRKLRPVFRSLSRLNLDRAVLPVLRRFDERAGNAFDILASPHQSAVITNTRMIRQKDLANLLPEGDDPWRLERSIDERWRLTDRPLDETYTYLMLRERNVHYVATVTKPLQHHDIFTYGPVLDFVFRLPMVQKKNRRLARKVAADMVPSDILDSPPSGLDDAHRRIIDTYLSQDRERYESFIDDFLDRDLVDARRARAVLLPDNPVESGVHEKLFMGGVFFLELWIKTFIERDEPWRDPRQT